MELMTRDSLGVPSWFAAECSLPLPGFGRALINKILGFTEGPCAAHDWAYFVGSTLEEAAFSRWVADREFRARIKHNAAIVTNHWYEKWKSPLGEAYYWAVMVSGRRHWMLRDEEPDDWYLEAFMFERVK